MDYMKTEVIQVLQKNGISHPHVNINLKQPGAQTGLPSVVARH